MPYSKCPTGTAGGRFTGYAAPWWHNSFNLHYFRPYFLWQISSLQFRPNLRFRFLLPTLPLSPYNATNRLKHAHRGNTTTSSHISISVAIPEKKKIQYLLYCIFFPLNISPTFPAFEPHSRIIFLLLITWCKIGVVFLD